MQAKNLMSFLHSKFILNDIISYCPENRILQIFRYNKKYQKILNIGLYNYQKEYLRLALKNVNPINYNISHLHNYFKFKNAFDEEKDKEIFDKIIKELIFDKITKDYILDKLNFKTVEDLSVVENLESLEFSVPDNFDLGKLKIPNIKNLKVSSYSFWDSVKMPFCLLNDLESLILSYFKLDIYSIPNGFDTFELKKLKYLKLANTKVIKELNVKLSTPNLINLIFDFFQYEEKKSFFAYYFDLFEEENEKSITDTDSFNDYKFTVPQNIIKRFYDKYINLKHFCLFRFDDGTSQEVNEKIVKGIKSKDDLVECFYTYRELRNSHKYLSIIFL